MNKHELFNLIGETDEDYVLAADRPVKRARPRWQTWAACAACAALVIGAYPLYNALRPQGPALHSYTVVEDGATGFVTQSSTTKAPAVGVGGEAPTPEPDSSTNPNSTEDEPHVSHLSQQAAITQYNELLRNAGISSSTLSSEAQYPAWYGGAWLDNDWLDHSARLTVAITDGFRTPELEAQILEWCGGTGDVLFCDTKYSYGYLRGLQEQLTESIFAEHIPCSFGVDVTANCLGLDIYADAAPESLLAVLAEFDPDGDAIQVQVHTGQKTINTYIEKGPAPDEPAADPVDPEDRADPIDGSAALPGGAQEDGAQETPPDGEETGVPAQYDAPSGIIELPEAKYDLLPLEE